MNSAALPICRPPLALFGTELWRAGLEFFSHQFELPVRVKAGDGHPVVIFPGLGTDGHAVAPLRDRCRALGYAAVDWGRGYNTGPQGQAEGWMRSLADDVCALIGCDAPSATLIGWSLGGVYAREVAKLIPGRVRQVITIGTPFNADRDHTNVGWLLRMLGGATPEFDAATAAALRMPPPLPTTSIYSRSDGVVAWQTCTHERQSEFVQDIEIQGSHFGMGWNRDVLQIVVDRLGQPPEAWQRHRVPAPPRCEPLMGG